jgi:WD40 repeat protein
VVLMELSTLNASFIVHWARAPRGVARAWIISAMIAAVGGLFLALRSIPRPAPILAASQAAAPAAPRQARDRRILSVAFSPDGNGLATGSEAGLQVWNLATGTLTWSEPKPAAGASSLVFSRDGRRLYCVRGYWSIEGWDVPARRILASWRSTDEEGVGPIALSPDGETLAGGSKRTVDLRGRDVHSMGNGPLVVEVAPGRTEPALQPLGEAGDMLVWDAQSLRLRQRLPNPFAGVVSVASSPDGRMLAAGGGNRFARIWDAHHLDAGPKQLLPYDGPEGVTVAFSPGGKTLALGGGGPLKFWDVNGPGAVPVLQGLAQVSPSSVSGHPLFSPDGALLATTTPGFVQFWNPHAHRPCGQLAVKGQGVVIAFSPNGRQLATGDESGTVTLWSIDAVRGHFEPGRHMHL